MSILRPQFKQSFILFLALFFGRVHAATVLEDRAFLRIGEQVFFEKRFLAEIPKLQILKCYFENAYLLSMEQILPDRFEEALITIKNWPRMRGLERDIFNLIVINKIDKHFRETGMDHMEHTERERLLNIKPQISKDCVRKLKGTPLSEFQQNIITMEFSLRERFSLGQSPFAQKTLAVRGEGEGDKLANAEKFMKQYIANVYFQYGHFIFHYVQ